jgi:predicted MFS family arabinose efflux permease
MSLCVAMLIASEFMPVSLLTPMAEGLGATTGQTGQAISISGLFAVATSLAITTVAGRINRKTVLVVLTALMLISLLGVCVGGFWSLATSILMRLVPEHDVPRALGLMYGGQAIAAAFAAPLGSYLGDIVGWRGVFWALTPVVALNLVWHLVALPSLPVTTRASFATFGRLLGRRHFRLDLIAITFTWGSAFTMFTYLRPFLEQMTGVGVDLLSVLLLVLGGAGFVGSSLSGRLFGGRVERMLCLPALVMGSCTAALLIAGGSVIAVGLLLAIWGAMNTAMSVIWMSWMSRNVDDLPEAAGGLMVAVIQASILMGGVIGGFLLDLWAIEATFGGSVLLALVALAITGTGRQLLKPNTES